MDPFQKMKMAVRNAVPGLNLFESTPDPAEGERLLALGNFAEAEQFFLRVLDQLGDRGHRRLSHAKLLFALANARFHQKKYSTAKEAALSTLEHLDAARPSLELADTHDLLATIFTELKEPENSIPHLEQALDAQTRIKPVDHGSIIQRRRKLAAALENIGKPEPAAEQFREAASIALRECGPEHQLTGDCEADLGRCLGLLKQHREAIEHLQAALKAHLIAPGSESEEVAKDYQMLATEYQETEDLETAVLYYEKALRLRERQLGGSSADYAALLMSFATAQSLRGSYGAAVELLQQAVGKFEGTRDERLGPALESLGTVYVLSGRVEDGIQSLKRARKIWEAHPEENRARLNSNTQLFETVSGYLNPREASMLMESIRPLDTSADSLPSDSRPLDSRPETKTSAAKKPRTATQWDGANVPGENKSAAPPNPPPVSYIHPGRMPDSAYLPPQPPGGVGLPPGVEAISGGQASLYGTPGSGYPGGPYSQPGVPSLSGYPADAFGPGRPLNSGAAAASGHPIPLDGGYLVAGGPGVGPAGATYRQENQAAPPSQDGGPPAHEQAYFFGAEPGSYIVSASPGPFQPESPSGHGVWAASAENPPYSAVPGSTYRAAVSGRTGSPAAWTDGVAAGTGDLSSATAPAPNVQGLPVPVPFAEGGSSRVPAQDAPHSAAADMLALREALGPIPAAPPARSGTLSGWDEMAFDFLPT